MKETLSRWVKANQVILKNAGSLVSSQLITSALGFLYWWLAARQFQPAAVGLASAAISAMMLLGSASALGLGTLLVGELPRQRGKAPALIATALLVAGAAGGTAGALFAVLAPALSPDLVPLAESIWSVGLFAAGACFTTVTLVLDQALIGLLRGELQLGRNSLFSLAKLLLLVAVGLGVAGRSGLLIYATWVCGSLISLGFLVLWAQRRGRTRAEFRPEWALLRRLGRAALGHHALNLALQMPGLALPVLVTILLSATANAHFYIAWMVVSLLFVVPSSLTTVLYAVGSAAPATLTHKLRQTLGLSVAIIGTANLGLLITGDFVLGSFGRSYQEAAPSLHILAFGVLPLIVRYHYVALSRIHGRAGNAAIFQAAGSVLELSLAATGAILGGLIGLSLGWVVAVTIEAVLMAPPVYQTALAGTRFAPPPAAPPPAPHLLTLDSVDSARWHREPARVELPEGGEVV